MGAALVAGDWIKVEKSTADKAEVDELADRLDLHRHAVLGKLVVAWSWLDDNTVDGVTHVRYSMLRRSVDRITECAGFVDAMVQVGWLEVDAEAEVVRIPHHDRHMSATAKKRAQGSARQQKRRSREKSTPCHAPALQDVTQVRTREEKRREEKIQEFSPPNPPPGGSTEIEIATGSGNRVRAEDGLAAFGPEAIESIRSAYPQDAEPERTSKAIAIALLTIRDNPALSLPIRTHPVAYLRDQTARYAALVAAEGLTPERAQTWYRAGRYRAEAATWRAPPGGVHGITANGSCHGRPAGAAQQYAAAKRQRLRQHPTTDTITTTLAKDMVPA